MILFNKNLNKILKLRKLNFLLIIPICFFAISCDYIDGHYKNFTIQTTTNMPNLRVDEKVKVDQFIYKSSEPKLGDMVALNKDNRMGVARIVALPNDIIAIESNIVVLNLIKSEMKFVNDTSGKLYYETFPNNHKHLIIKEIFKPLPEVLERRKLKETKIPKDCYYVLGDNRDNSLDSRYYGFIKKSDIVGKLVKILSSDIESRIDMEIK